MTSDRHINEVVWLKKKWNDLQVATNVGHALNELGDAFILKNSKGWITEICFNQNGRLLIRNQQESVCLINLIFILSQVITF